MMVPLSAKSAPPVTIKRTSVDLMNIGTSMKPFDEIVTETAIKLCSQSLRKNTVAVGNGQQLLEESAHV